MTPLQITLPKDDWRKLMYALSAVKGSGRKDARAAADIIAENMSETDGKECSIEFDRDTSARFANFCSGRPVLFGIGKAFVEQLANEELRLNPPQKPVSAPEIDEAGGREEWLRKLEADAERERRKNEAIARAEQEERERLANLPKQGALFG